MTSSQRSRRPQPHLSFGTSPVNISHAPSQEISGFHNGMITEISDYYDKAQIHNALLCMPNTEDKIKLVDFIIKARETKHRALKKKKTQIIDDDSSVQKNKDSYQHLPNHKHRFKKSLNDLVEQEPSLKEINPTISSLVNTESAKKYKPFEADNNDYEEDDDSFHSEIEGTRLVFPVEEHPPVLQRQGSHGKLISLSSFSSSNGLKFGQTYSENLFRKKPGNLSGSPSPRVRPLGKVEESPSTLRNVSRGSSMASYSLLKDPQRRAKESLPLSRAPSSLNREQDNTVFSLGAKRLEKDIYRYLVKNERKKTENKVVLNLNHKKEKIRNIEARAIMQYKQLKRAEEKFNDYKDSFTVAMKTERARTRSINSSSGKSDISQLSLSRSGSKGLIKLDAGKRNSKFIRRVDSDQVFIAKPVVIEPHFLKKKVSINDLNESVDSYTEARLDCLYSETERLSKGVEDIERKMNLAHDEGELKSLLQARDVKKKHLRQRTSKLEVLVKKKMMNAFS